MTTGIKPAQIANYQWIDGRWHLDGQPLHAGDQIEILTPDGWRTVRVYRATESLGLRVCVNFHGLIFTRTVGNAKLRWPERV